MTESGSSRRTFLARMGRASAGAACVGLAGWTVGCATVARVSPVVEGRVARIPLSAFEGGPGVLVSHPDEGLPVYVHRHGPRRFTAVLTRCTHRGCQVDPVPERLVCPCHGSEYELDGGLLAGPAEASLITYPATVEGRYLRLDLDPTGGPS